MRSLSVIVTLVVSATAAVFDLPREIFMDVNKGSQDTINIIADRASFLARGAGVGGALKSMHPSESSAMINSVLADALVAAAATEGVPVEALTCSRNYSSCPVGWGPLGGECVAPVNYAGACGGRISTAGMTPAEIANQAAVCGVTYPCA